MMDESDFRHLFDRLRASVPWGPDDRRGALNYITPDVVVAAASEVTIGRNVSLAASIRYARLADNPEPARHQMTATAGSDGDDDQSGLEFAMDRMTMNVHGNADSHLDALCHVAFDGHFYNGVSVGTVTDDGAGALSVEAASDGIVSRGVLLDVPRTRGIPWVEPGDSVTPGDLLATESEEGLSVQPGDIVLVRVGHRRRRAELGPWDAAGSRAGLDPLAVELLGGRGTAVLGSDGNNDTAPSPTPVAFPTHVLAVNALGIHLMDYLQLDELAALCQAGRRWTFLCTIAPLRLSKGTGSPVNPIAVL